MLPMWIISQYEIPKAHVNYFAHICFKPLNHKPLHYYLMYIVKSQQCIHAKPKTFPASIQIRRTLESTHYLKIDLKLTKPFIREILLIHKTKGSYLNRLWIVETIKYSQSLWIRLFSNTLAVKNKSVKSDQIFGKWLKFLPTNIFCRLFFLTDQNFYRPTNFTD